MGRLSLGSETAQAAGALILPGETTPDDAARLNTATLPVVDHAWAPSNGGKIQTDLAIVLENVAAGYKKPNILDVKLGARLWADDAPVEKRQRLDKAAEETTSKTLGFRIAGMKTYHKADSLDVNELTNDGYMVFDKYYGRGFNVGTVRRGFEEFFLLEHETKATGPVRKVIRRFIDDLKDMVEVIEKKESRMYSASLLFVYEGDAEALDSAFIKESDILDSLRSRDVENFDRPISNTAVQGHGGNNDEDGSDEDESGFPPIQNLKLIDFAHAQWTPGQGPDENLLLGTRNVIKTLQTLIAPNPA